MTEKERLDAERDANGELPPPWARYPTYERYTIGWRMGSGETYLGLLRLFLKELGDDHDARLAYLRRHPPAPFSWSDWIGSFLATPAATADDDDDEEDEDDETDATFLSSREARLRAHRKLGVIAPDIAYSTWLAQQSGIRWPWEVVDTPLKAARHWTRDLQFWSRQVAAARAEAGWRPPEVPDAWAVCALPLQRGAVDLRAAELRQGLVALAQALAAGDVPAPWQLGLELTDFADTFDDDMGYVDAFRLWGMCTFDDTPTISAYLTRTAAPPPWRAWFAEHVTIG